MNQFAYIAGILLISFVLFAGLSMVSNTFLVSQASFGVWVTGPSASQQNWGNSVSKTSGRAITVCSPGEKRCLTEEGFSTCLNTGTSWSYMTPCPELFYCEKDVNQCVPRDCLHGSTYCRNSTHYVKCVAGLIDSDSSYSCAYGCDILTNKCAEPDWMNEDMPLLGNVVYRI